MIAAWTQMGDGETLMLGLTQENFERMRTGQPLMLDLAAMQAASGAPNAVKLILFAGESEDALLEDLEYAMPGAIDAALLGGRVYGGKEWLGGAPA